LNVTPQRRLYRLSALALAGLLSPVSSASADWLIIPHLGAVFGGNTTIVDLDQGAGSRKFTFGGSFAWLTDGIVGAEADVGHTPHFFERSSRGALVLDSTVTTVSGSVLAAVPLSVTRESLRPYLAGGVGLIHASSNDAAGIFSFDSNLLALNVGGGVIGFITPFTGVRFDLRHFRNLAPDDSATTTSGSTRLSFWRASVGVVLRY
jgi:hypothetical protein